MIDLIRKNDFNRDYLEYKLNEVDIVDTFSQGMIENNDVSGIIKSSFQQINNEKYFYFDVSALETLEDFLNNAIGKKDLIKTIVSMINTFELAEDYMIDEKCFILQTNYIFIDQHKNIKLIYLPIENIKSTFDLSALIKHILMTAKYQIGEDTSYVMKILNFLNSKTVFSLDEVKSFLLNINVEKQIDQRISKIQPESVEPVNTQPRNRVHTDPKINIQPRNVQGQKVKENLNHNVLIKEKKELNEEKPVEEKVVKTSKRRDGIPTLKNRKGKTNIEAKAEKKKSILPIKKKEKTKTKISTKKNSIPTLNKRKDAVVNEENNQLNRDLKMQYSKEEVGTTQFAGTTVLGVAEGTTLLTEGTTLLDNQEDVVSYPTLIRLSNNQKMFVNKAVFSIGRDSTRNDFVVTDNTAVSGEHAEIRLENGRYYISDLKSTNKTIVDGNVLKPGYKMELYSGSRIKIADEDFEFEL